MKPRRTSKSTSESDLLKKLRQSSASRATPTPIELPFPRTERFLNRELAWLEFNHRVLEEARDPAIPLLERLRFLSITASNLDEFVMVRIGSLKVMQDRTPLSVDPTGLTAEQQLKAIVARMRKLVAEQYDTLKGLEAELAKEGFARVGSGDLDRGTAAARRFFEQDLLPVISPQAIDDNMQFPFLLNLSLNLCVRLASADGVPRFAIIPLGKNRARFVKIPTQTGHRYLLAEDVAKMYIDQFFQGEKVEECVPFRVTRNADLELHEELAADLLTEMRQVLQDRIEGDCIRLEIAEEASSEICQFLQFGLGITDEEVFRLPGPVELSSFMRLADTPGFDAIRYEAWPANVSAQFDPAESLFESISRRDILLFHPYESFDPVVRLVEDAAIDPDVLAIKQTLYRTSSGSPIVAALQKAAQKGKAVTVLVELKARFDEARNIEWARNLERDGVQVIYGVRGFKTHAKVCVIVRRSPQGIQRYVHFGTGNYNEQTSKIYSDVSLITAHDEFGADATAFFHAITGYSQPTQFRKIEAAPIGLRERILQLIQGEIEQVEEGQAGLIHAKLNALVDEEMIDALYRASIKGVEVRLSVRGICCLKPGLPGLSENIAVTSVIDRFLEHSRILRFRHGGDDLLFLSSADWMPRNLDRRLELLVPVEDPAARERLLQTLAIHLKDTAKAWKLKSDGSYQRVKPPRGKEPLRSQEVLYRRAANEAQEILEARPTQFQPHRALSSE